MPRVGVGVRVLHHAPRPLESRIDRVRRRSSGDGEHAIAGDGVDKALQRFLRLWTGAAHCRRLVSSSSKNSIFRDGALLEARARSLLRSFPPLDDGTCGTHGVDVPATLVREPMLLTCTDAEFVRGVLRAKKILRLTGRQLTLAPGLILCENDALERGVRSLVERFGGEGEAFRAIGEQPDVVLAEIGWWDEGESDEVDVKRALRHYARAIPPAGDEFAVRERVAERERTAKKFHVDDV